MKWLGFINLLVVLLLATPRGALAQTYSSGNYQVNQVMFGTGGELDATAGSYRAQSSVGGLGVGSGSSTNYDSEAGYLTAGEPFLEVGITGPNVDLGTLSASTTSYISSQGGTCNCTFYVRTYTSSGYTVVTASQPPTSESNNSLTAKGTQGPPSGSTSVEEFGINLVSNTSPGVFGANLTNDPDNSFADGQVANGYQTTNQFKYGVGDIIARSQATAGNQGVGKTNYTISYIAKASNISKAGTYTMRHDLIVVPTY